jgi:dTDP-4-dehydrorhamnose reductase
MVDSIVVLGATGMLGHKLVQVLDERFEVWATTRATAGSTDEPNLFREPDRLLRGVDATDLDSVARAIAVARPSVVINCVGIIKQLDEARDPIPSIEVNALFPHRLAALCAGAGARLIHLSTDCVFSGRSGGYSEDDEADAGDLYGRTKLLGEVTGPGCLTLRTSMIGRDPFKSVGLLEWFIGRRGGSARGFTRAVFSGFTTTALARILGDLVSDHPRLQGLYHVAGEAISKHDLLVRINRAMALGIEVEPAEEPRCDRSLDGSRFRAATGLEIPSWDRMIEELATDSTPYDEWRRRHGST